jgi:hypothetical protein
MSQKFEYLVREFKTVDAGGMTQCVNKLAEDGWELISVNPPLHYFKRDTEEQTVEREQAEQDEVYGQRQA